MAFKLIQAFQNRPLAIAQNHLSQQLALLAKVRGALPFPLASHVVHCVAGEQKLLLYTDSAAWASQLRFSVQDILRAAASENRTFTRLQVRILADRVELKKPNGDKANVPSAASIAMLQTSAEQLEDGQLQEALQKLSATLARLKK